MKLILEDEMAGSCSTREWGEICIQNFDRKIWMEETTRKTWV